MCCGVNACVVGLLKGNDMSEWISINDRLPLVDPQWPCSDSVLFSDGESVNYGSYWPKGYSSTGKPHWANEEGVIVDDEGDTTHWMPLPDPPAASDRNGR